MCVWGGGYAHFMRCALLGNICTQMSCVVYTCSMQHLFYFTGLSHLSLWHWGGGGGGGGGGGQATTKLAPSHFT